MNAGVLVITSNLGGGIIGLADKRGQVAAVFGHSLKGITFIALLAVGDFLGYFRLNFRLRLNVIKLMFHGCYSPFDWLLPAPREQANYIKVIVKQDNASSKCKIDNMTA